MKCEVKHRDMGMGRLWLNGWDSYGKLLFPLEIQCMVKNAGLQGSTLSGHRMTTGFGPDLWPTTERVGPLPT